MSEYFAVCYFYPDGKIEMVNNKYYSSLVDCSNIMLDFIKKYQPSMNSPLFDCNIGIYKIQILVNKNTNDHKIIYQSKVMPNNQSYNKPPTPDLIKYLELCDDEDMNVCKLQLEIYGNLPPKINNNHDLCNREYVLPVKKSEYTPLFAIRSIDEKNVEGEIYKIGTHYYYGMQQSYTLEGAVDTMMNMINIYKKPPNDWDPPTIPINMDCKYNIALFEVDVWSELYSRYETTTIIKQVDLETLSKYNGYNKAKFEKYLKLYDKPGMNVAQLCLEIFGPNITQKDIDEKVQIELEKAIVQFEKELDSAKNTKPIYIEVSDHYDQYHNKIAVSMYAIRNELIKKYSNKGYYIKTSRGSGLYVFEQSYIDSLFDKLQKMINKDNDIKNWDKEYEKIKFDNYESKNLLSKNISDRKHYILGKFLVMNPELSEYTILFIRDKFGIHPPDTCYGYYMS